MHVRSDSDRLIVIIIMSFLWSPSSFSEYAVAFVLIYFW